MPCVPLAPVRVHVRSKSRLNSFFSLCHLLYELNTGLVMQQELYYFHVWSYAAADLLLILQTIYFHVKHAFALTLVNHQRLQLQKCFMQLFATELEVRSRVIFPTVALTTLCLIYLFLLLLLLVHKITVCVACCGHASPSDATFIFHSGKYSP